METILDLELSTLSTLNQDQPVVTQPEPEETGSLCVLDESGDSRMQWTKSDPQQVAAAKARFDELKSKGYLAYKVDKSGQRGEVIDRFDAKAERIILHSRMIGG